MNPMLICMTMRVIRAARKRKLLTRRLRKDHAFDRSEIELHPHAGVRDYVAVELAERRAAVEVLGGRPLRQDPSKAVQSNP